MTPVKMDRVCIVMMSAVGDAVHVDLAAHVAARDRAGGCNHPFVIHRADEAHFIAAGKPDSGAHGSRGGARQPRFADVGHVLRGFFFAAGKSTLLRIRR